MVSFFLPRGQEPRRNERIHMELKEGDLVVTLPKVDKVKSVLGKLGHDMLGVVVETSPRFDTMAVYGVLIDGEVFYLFEDEIEKVEEEC